MRKGSWAYWEEEGKEPTLTGYIGLWLRMLGGTIKGLLYVVLFLGLLLVFWYLVYRVTGYSPPPCDTLPC